MWIWETRRVTPPHMRGAKWWFLALTNGLLIITSLFLAITGLVSAIVSLNRAVQSGAAAPFSCADNSNLT